MNQGHKEPRKDAPPGSGVPELLSFIERNYGWWMRLAKNVLIWSVFFGLLYVLRDFFAIVFLTFIFCFIMNSLIHGLSQRVSWPWKVKVTVVFIVFLGLWVGTGFLVVPLAQEQGKKFVDDFPNTKAKLEAQWDSFLKDNPKISELVKSEKKEMIERVNTFLKEDVVAAIVRVIRGTVAAGTVLVLALLFSLLILLDLPRLKNEVVKLKESKIHTFYEVTGGTVAKFGEVLGKVFEAQAVIAIVNTALTALGLWILNVPSIFFLSFIVFLGSFVPVLGVWISSVPVCLLGLVDSGVGTMFTLIAFITVIHMIEAYILNPRIMGAALHINPVLVLAILFVSAHIAGFWGVLLGVPTVFYFFKYVISQEKPEVGLRARRSAAKVPETANA